MRHLQFPFIFRHSSPSCALAQVLLLIDKMTGVAERAATQQRKLRVHEREKVSRFDLCNCLSEDCIQLTDRASFISRMELKSFSPCCCEMRMEITLKLLSSKIFRPISLHLQSSKSSQTFLQNGYFFLSAFLLSGRTQNATFRLQFHEGNGRNYFRDLFLPGYNSKNHHPRDDGREIERNLDSQAETAR